MFKHNGIRTNPNPVPRPRKPITPQVLITPTGNRATANQVVGIDWSNGEDYTEVTSICSGCKTVVHTEYYPKDSNIIQPTIYKECPECKKEFKHIVRC